MAEEIETGTAETTETEPRQPGRIRRAGRWTADKARSHWKWLVLVLVLGGLAGVVAGFGWWPFGGDDEVAQVTPVPDQPPPQTPGPNATKTATVTPDLLRSELGKAVSAVNFHTDGQLGKAVKAVNGHTTAGVGAVNQHTDDRAGEILTRIEECGDCDDDNNGQAKVPTPTPRPTPTSEPPTPSKAPTPVAEEPANLPPTKVAEAPRPPRGGRRCVVLTHFGGNHTTICP